MEVSAAHTHVPPTRNPPKPTRPGDVKDANAVPLEASVTTLGALVRPEALSTTASSGEPVRAELRQRWSVAVAPSVDGCSQTIGLGDNALACAARTAEATATAWSAIIVSLRTRDAESMRARQPAA